MGRELRLARLQNQDSAWGRRRTAWPGSCPWQKRGGESSLAGKPLAGEGKEQKGSDGFSESSSGRGKVKKRPNQSPGKGRGQRWEGPHALEKALREVLGLPPNKRGHRSTGKQRKRQVLAFSPLTPRHAFWGAGIQRKKEQPKEKKITWAVKGGRDPEGQALPET